MKKQLKPSFEPRKSNFGRFTLKSKHYIARITATALLAGIVCTAFALPVTVQNHSFEIGMTVKSQNWMNRLGTGANIITNWFFRMDDSVWVDTSVEGNNSGSEGNWCASIYGEQWPEGIWQNLEHPIALNKNYTLTVDIGNGWEATRVKLALRYHEGTNRINIASEIFPITGGGGSFQGDASVSFVAQSGAPYIGKNLGVEIQNVSQNWVWVDNVRVDESDAYVAQPSNVFPPDGATNVSVTPMLVGSAFDGSYTHEASQWQIDRDDKFTFTTWDSGEDSVNLTNMAVPSGALGPGEFYFWRLRYKDASDLWSDWSQPTTFVTEGSPNFFLLSDDNPLSPSSAMTYTGTKDANLSEYSANKDNNNGGYSEFEICQYWHEGTNDRNRALLAFPRINAYFPAEEWEITNAWLELYFNHEINGGGFSKTVYVHRVLKGTDNHSWGEGTGASGIDGRTAAPGEVTWHRAQQGDVVDWDGAGAAGYLAATDEGDGTGTVLSNNFGWIRFPLKTETACNWQTNNTAASLGVCIREPDPPVETNGTKVFFASENSATNKRPRLYLAGISVIAVVRPVNLSPADATTLDTLTPSLIASPFEAVGGGTHAASQWQLTSDNQFTNIVFDEISTNNLITNSVPSGVLADAEYYFWRVRFRRDDGKWSAWSLATLFRAPGEYVPGKLVLSEDNRIISGELFDTNTYTGAKDALLTEHNPDNNTGGYMEMEACRYNGTDFYDNKNMVLAFQNVALYAPISLYEITNAWIELFFVSERNGQEHDKTLYVHRLLRGTEDHTWNEGEGADSMDGRDALTGEVTWNSAQDGDVEFWEGTTTNNCAAAVPEGDGIVLSSNFGWVTFPLKLDTVLNWQTNDDAAALGVCIRESLDPTFSSTNNGTKVFASSESPSSSARPRLCLAVEFIPEPALALSGVFLALLAVMFRKFKQY